MSTLVTGTAGATHHTGAPLTTAITAQAAPDLLVNALDRRIVKLAPAATPLDQISRVAGARKCGSMTVEYYCVDSKPSLTTASADLNIRETERNSDDTFSLTIKVADPKIFDVSETILLPSSLDANNNPAVAYVTAVGKDSIDVLMDDCTPYSAIKSGDPVVRMGRAAGELDVETPQFNALPKKDSNHCQIFKAQVEQSILQKLADKEVGWTFSDQEEAAILDMRAGMERSFLFGKRMRLRHPDSGEELFLTGGIWEQTSKSFSYTSDNISHGDVIEICRKAFTGNNSSRRKLLMAGSGLVAALMKLPADKTIALGQTVARWGIEARELVSNFGRLYIVHSEIFDQCGHANDGLVIDPAFLTKYTHIPFSAQKLDMRSSGKRNTEAIVLTEASCLVLRHPDAHLKILGK